CIDELMPLCQQVFELEESRFTRLQLNFDAELFEHCEQLDSFHCLVMRKDGAAIGFHWIFITPMLRHKGMAQAHTDAIFVNPDYRNHSAKLLQ
ncbi:GNAT family N-acetyltransferase, partial [Klebsiella pneumoniae]|uniref:GNAT family N-acetyltransferase n=1 Tax=Klebsiella pneumoniae TaxID=573 RepID=UPI00133114EA